MIGYATSTRTKKNLQVLAAAGWRLLLTPDIHANPGMGYALDNGAYGCWLRGEPFNEAGFTRLLQTKGRGADWIVVPDIVASGTRSLHFSLEWLPYVQEYGLSLLAVQDGMTPSMLEQYIGPDVGLFVGGSTEWKLAQLSKWGCLAQEAGCYLHVGRVNSQKRIRMCCEVGANSFDGTSVTRYAKTITVLEKARRECRARRSLRLW